MNLDFLKNTWNVLLGAAGALVIFISGFVDVPYYASAALSTNNDYITMSKFIVAVIIALMLIVCFFLNKKKTHYLIVDMYIMFYSRH
jgi:hypothetical protein